MILQAVEVRAYRSLKDPLRIELAADLVNVLHGRNGSGKSTLVSAIARGFFENYGTNASSAREMIPWSTTLSPEVNLEFEACGKRYRLEKRFFKRKSAQLFVRDGGKWSATHQDDDVERRLRDLMYASAGGGYSQSGLSGLSQVLWSVQGALPLGRVDQSVADLVRQSFELQTESPQTRLLFQSVEAFRRKFWADTKDQLKTGKDAPELLQLRERKQQVVAELVRRRDTLQTVDRLREEIAMADASLQQSSEETARRTAEHDSLARDLAEFSRIRVQIDSLEPKHKLSQQQYAELEERIRRIQTLSQELRQIEERRAEAEPKWMALRQAEETATVEWQQLRQGTAIREKLQGLHEESAALRAPKPAELEGIRKLVARSSLLEAALDSALLHVEFEPEIASTIHVVEGEPEGALALEPGVTLRVSGSPRIVIDAPVLGRIRVSGPKASVDEIRGNLAAVQTEIDRQCAPYGTQDVEELDRRKSRALEIESEAGGIEARWIAAQAEAAARKAETEKQRAAVESNVATLRNQREEKGPELAGFLADGRTPEERQRQLEQFAMDSLAYRTKLEELQHSVANYPADLSERAAQSEIARNRALEALDKSKTALTVKRVTLDQIAAGAPYERVVEIEEELRDLERKIHQEQIRADAALLLHKTSVICRAKAKTGVAGPVSERATEYLSRIAGRDLGTIRVSDDLAPREFVPENTDDGVPLPRLSGGEIEQVHLATRLALARVLAENERQLVVLDDVLTATDDERLGRILEIVEELRARLQFLVLTCHRERYANLPKVRFIDLEAAVQDATAAAR